MRASILSAIVFAVVVHAAPALAQEAARTRAAVVQTEAAVDVNDRAVESGALPFVLPDTAVVRTGQGRAAIALKRGGTLFLDTNSSVRIAANGVYNFNRIEVLTGSAIVASGTSAPVVACESDIRLSDGGTFRFDVRPQTSTGGRPCRFRVFEGAAAVPLVTVTNALRAGQTMTCDRQCGDMVPTNQFSPEQLDDFDRWARRVREQLQK